jgi:hypothetical protein
MRLNFWSPGRTIQTFEFQISIYFFAVCFWLFITRLITAVEMFDCCNTSTLLMAVTYLPSCIDCRNCSVPIAG